MLPPLMQETISIANLLEEQELARFIQIEARLIDEGRFDEWAALFASDGVYWVPAGLKQTDPFAVLRRQGPDRGARRSIAAPQDTCADATFPRLPCHLEFFAG
jgi:hypothetical protein